ncbi:MAG: cupin domain-containing protein [Candidatus Thiodiazotropha sp.]
MSEHNLLDGLPEGLAVERFDELLRHESVRIERILSQGQASPEQGWYDQDEHEWVLVLQGHARLEFENGPDVELKTGDYLEIPAHRGHRVAWTDPQVVTVWLAVFFRSDDCPAD